VQQGRLADLAALDRIMRTRRKLASKRRLKPTCSLTPAFSTAASA
jgi:hypothetical protein